MSSTRLVLLVGLIIFLIVAVAGYYIYVAINASKVRAEMNSDAVTNLIQQKGHQSIADTIIRSDRMAREVANINGKKVFSDKPVTSIINTRVVFGDGSWCDVATGEVVNKGTGCISIGAPVSGSTKRNREQKEFNANALDISNLSATDVDIQVHCSKTIEIVKEGGIEEIKRINIFQNGDTVIVEGEEGGRSGNIRVGSISISSGRFSGSVISGMGNFKSVGGGNVCVGGSNKGSNDTKVSIKVPKGTSISISNIDGFTSIGDTEGRLNVNASTGGDVKIGCVADTTINIQGSGDVNIQQVNGILSAGIQGSGDIKIRKGKVSTLNASIQGSGGINFGGEAENADLSIMGSGDIDIAHVKNRPIKNVMGSGDINIGNW